jgi:hypothetical protein
MSDCPPPIGDAAKLMTAKARTKSDSIARTLSLTNAMIVRGTSGCVSIVLNSQGDENALGFSLHFDTNLLTFLSAQPGSDAAAAPQFLVNTQSLAQGLMGIALLLPANSALAAGPRRLVDLCFQAKAGANEVTTPILFGDSPIRIQISDRFANELPVSFSDGAVTLMSDAGLIFDSITRQENGAMALGMSGPTGVWEIRSSSNLLTWQPVAQLTNTNGRVQFLDAGASNAPQRFYKAFKQ